MYIIHYACAPLHVYLWCGEIDLALSYMFPCKDLLGLGTLAVGMTWIYLNYTVTMKTTQQNSMLPISDPPLKLRADIWIHSCHSPQTRTDAHFALRNPFCQRIRILQQHLQLYSGPQAQHVKYVKDWDDWGANHTHTVFNIVQLFWTCVFVLPIISVAWSRPGLQIE